MLGRGMLGGESGESSPSCLKLECPGRTGLFLQHPRVYRVRHPSSSPFSRLRVLAVSWSAFLEQTAAVSSVLSLSFFSTQSLEKISD